MAATQQSLLVALDAMQRDAHSPRLEHRPSPPLFDGESYEPERDEIRLSGQLARVFNCMRDGRYRTLSEIRFALSEEGLRPKDSEAGISARLRDLRKKRWGSHVVNRRRRTEGTFEYQVIVNA